MKLALIPPIAMLSDTLTQDYHLLLPHLLENEDYATFYGGNNEDDFYILDNGAAEGKEVDFGTLMEHADRLSVDELVIPDVLGDKERTLELFWQHIESFNDLECDPMVVVQGETVMECDDFISQMVDYNRYMTLGIPRHLLKRTGDIAIRLKLAAYARGRGHSGRLHALGASNYWPTEVSSLSDMGMFNGMDTSMPYMYGLQEVSWPHVPFAPSTGPKRSDDYFTTGISELQWEMCAGNSAAMKRVVDGA
jgi:hypothetical protein